MSRPEHQIGNSQLISAVNSRLVLQAIRALQPTYRAEVARHTRLTPATVTGIVNGLLTSATKFRSNDGEYTSEKRMSSHASPDSAAWCKLGSANVSDALRAGVHRPLLSRGHLGDGAGTRAVGAGRRSGR